MPLRWVPCLRLRRHAELPKKTWLHKRSHGTRLASAAAPRSSKSAPPPMSTIRKACGLYVFSLGTLGGWVAPPNLFDGAASLVLNDSRPHGQTSLPVPPRRVSAQRDNSHARSVISSAAQRSREIRPRILRSLLMRLISRPERSKPVGSFCAQSLATPGSQPDFSAPACGLRSK
jgi:hypothetical protein